MVAVGFGVLRRRALMAWVGMQAARVRGSGGGPEAPAHTGQPSEPPASDLARARPSSAESPARPSSQHAIGAATR